MNFENVGWPEPIPSIWVDFRHAPRIVFKAKGRILFLDLAEIVAVQAEGNSTDRAGGRVLGVQARRRDFQGGLRRFTTATASRVAAATQAAAPPASRRRVPLPWVANG
jgi:hypothetical protein